MSMKERLFEGLCLGLAAFRNPVNADRLQCKHTFVVVVVKLDTGRVREFIAPKDGFLKCLNSAIKTAARHRAALTNVQYTLWIIIS